MDKFNRPETHRDRTKYNRVEDYWKDQLDDYLDDLEDSTDEEKARKKEEFEARLKGEEYDPDMQKEWERYLENHPVLGGLNFDDDFDDMDFPEDDYYDYDDYDDYSY